MNCTSAITPCVCGNLPGMSIRSDFFGRDYCGPTRNCKGNWCREFKLRPQRAVDPNVKAGPTGVSDAAFVVSGMPLAYTVQFENLPSATGAAQVVIVTDQLDVQKLDLDTFELGPISFGERALVPPPDSQSYAGGIDLRPGQDLIVTVVAGLDRSTGLVTWTFTSIDPNTGQLTEDPAAGFLPPNTSPPAGEGMVTFSVASKAGLATGTSVANQASIVFDINAAIETPTWLNTIDRSAPLTRVLPLAATVSSPEFTVEWAGTDAGAGIFDPVGEPRTAGKIHHHSR
jgi:hypothetical protein